MTAKKIKAAIKRALDITTTLQSVRPLYNELDEITVGLVEEGVLTFADGEFAMTIVDNFAEKNTVFRVARLKRYDIKFGPGIPEIPMKKRPKTPLAKPKKDPFRVRKNWADNR